MSRIKNVICVFPVMALLTMSGCSSKSPSCSDDRTLATVKKIVAENLSKDSATIASLISQIKLDLIVTSNHDESVDKYICGAQITVPLTPSLKQKADEVLQEDTKSKELVANLMESSSEGPSFLTGKIRENIQTISALQEGPTSPRFE